MVVSPVESETSSNTELSPDTSAPPLRRSTRILERCKPSSSSASACGLSSGTDVRQVPFSYSVPCPALVLHAEEKPIKRNSMS